MGSVRDGRSAVVGAKIKPMTLTLLATLAAAQTPTIQSFLQPAFEDVTFVARKVSASTRELQKINSDFGQSYKFDKIKFFYKEPMKLRLEASVEETTALYIVNGPKQSIRVPRLKIKVDQDLSRAPGRRQSSLDFGVLTAALFKGFLDATFVRFDRATGNPIFDLTYEYKDDSSRYRVWIDKDQKYVVRREWYGQSGRQKATFLYNKPVKVDGVWFATQTTVKNVEDKVAGVTRYENLKLNTGLPDSLFDVR